MARPNPTNIKTALTGGATYSAGKIVVSGVAHFVRLDTDVEGTPEAPVWVLDVASGVKIYNKTHFERMRDYPLLDEGEYQWCFDIPANLGGRKQLLQTNFGGPDVAALQDP